MHRPAAPQHPGRRGVVIEGPLQRVHDLVVERRLGGLGETADEDLDLLRLVQPADTLRRQNVDHPRGEATVGDDRDSLGFRLLVQLLLLQEKWQPPSTAARAMGPL